MTRTHTERFDFYINKSPHLVRQTRQENTMEGKIVSKKKKKTKNANTRGT